MPVGTPVAFDASYAAGERIMQDADGPGDEHVAGAVVPFGQAVTLISCTSSAGCPARWWIFCTASALGASLKQNT